MAKGTAEGLSRLATAMGNFAGKQIVQSCVGDFRNSSIC